jgi:hypothetical protein
MKESAYIGGVAAGLAFLIAGTRLLRLSVQTGEAPERLLGATFLLWSLSYLFSGLGIALGSESLITPFMFIGHLIVIVSDITFERIGVWSATLDSLVGTLELTAIALIWLVFFPPHFYQRWIDDSVRTALAREG